MEKYQIIDCLGNGSYGIVNRALNLQTKELVAIKTLKEKFSSYEECLKLREVRALLKLKEHPNIIQLKKSLKFYTYLIVLFENEQLHLIFEFIETNIFQMYQSEKLSEESIKNIVHQCAKALQYIHSNGFFHRGKMQNAKRDLKPENILVQNNLVKVIDFGLVREINSKPPFTDYVSTRWYRAPEILLHQTTYDQAVDIFALGCIMCELFLSKPLFMGNSESDQFYKLNSILGSFSKQNWPEGHKLMNGLGLKMNNCNKVNLNTIIKNASLEGIRLIDGMLKWNPKERLSAEDIVNDSYFAQGTPEFAGKLSQKQYIQTQQINSLGLVFQKINLQDQPKQKEQKK